MELEKLNAATVAEAATAAVSAKRERLLEWVRSVGGPSEVQRRTGISSQAFSLLKNGKSAYASPQTIETLALVYGSKFPRHWIETGKSAPVETGSAAEEVEALRVQLADALARANRAEERFEKTLHKMFDLQELLGKPWVSDVPADAFPRPEIVGFQPSYRKGTSADAAMMLHLFGG